MNTGGLALFDQRVGLGDLHRPAPLAASRRRTVGGPGSAPVQDAGRRAANDTWSVPSEGPLGPWVIGRAHLFVAEPELFAAPLVQRRDGSWVLIGFRNTEPCGIDSFFITDPIPVTLDADGYLIAR